MMFYKDQFITDCVVKRKESLFHRDMDVHAPELKKRIQGKSILVIGGAGSIGSSYIRTLLPFEPSSLVVVDLNENGLAELTRDLRSSSGIILPEAYRTYPFDYSTDVFRRMFQDHKGFDIIANFSAHKHVRSEKDIYSVEALLENNLLNARKLLELISEYPPETYFCVSTDKAANPVNIMGASKRIMEDLIFSFSNCFPTKTARFANVAFSNGSLPDGFLKRIEKRQPLSAPIDIKRYFVSPEESGQICLLACVLGENRDIFFPKLEKTSMMSFDEIARNLLEELGYEVLTCSSDREAIEKMWEISNNRYPVHFSRSDTSGEKPYEEFFTTDETVDLSLYYALGVIRGKPIPDKKLIEKLFQKLREQFQSGTATKDSVVAIMQSYLASFRHIETGKNLDEKM